MNKILIFAKMFFEPTKILSVKNQKKKKYSDTENKIRKIQLCGRQKGFK